MPSPSRGREDVQFQPCRENEGGGADGGHVAEHAVAFVMDLVEPLVAGRRVLHGREEHGRMVCHS